MSGPVLLAVLWICLTVGAVTPAPADAVAFRKVTFGVPVSAPDSNGNPVEIDTDVYLPDSAPPARGYPLLELFHGGGSSKDNGFDAGHAASFAAGGYVVILYSARGHGSSSGQTTIAGPAEMHDLFDLTAWALGIGGRSAPTHASFHIDPGSIALGGYSQGGLHTNLGQVWSADRTIDPYGLSFRALIPGNTPEYVFPSLVPNGVVKLSFGLGLLQTYLVGASAHVAPIVDRWIATTAADQPQLYGAGDLCDQGTHDDPSSSMRQDLAWRSVGCHPDRMALPWHWAQSFDDTLFLPDMAISMWNRAPRRADHRLYLSMGGHGAPSADPVVEADKLRTQVAFLNAVMRGRPLPGPNIVYWTRDPAVAVPSSSYVYPKDAWYRGVASDWPPPGTHDTVYKLGADGRAIQGTAASAAMPLAAGSQDETNDPVAQTAFAATPLGTSAPSAAPASKARGLIASFQTEPFRSDMEMSGSPRTSLPWTPASPDTQLVFELFVQRPDGTLMIVSRGVQGLRSAQTGREQQVAIAGNDFSVRLRRGDRLVAWVMSGNAGFYKPYAGSLGGSLRTGNQATLTVPLSAPAPAGPTVGAVPIRHVCISRRSFIVHLRRRYRGSVLSARVFIGRRVVARMRSGASRARVSLGGLPVGGVRVKIVMRLSDGRTLTDTRRYRLCANPTPTRAHRRRSG